MLYVSTRGEAPAISFSDALLAGLARDGGLYVPERWPELSPATIADFRGKSYGQVAFEVIRPFVAGSFRESELSRMIGEAYATFDDPAVAAPAIQVNLGHKLSFTDHLHELPHWSEEQQSQRDTVYATYRSNQHPDHDTVDWPPGETS